MSKARANAETLRTALVAGDVTNANFTGADLELGKGGTGSSTAGAARTALGVAIGTDVLAPDGSAANLTNLPAGGAEDFVASGTLPNGKPVILKANGQVEVVAGITNFSSTALVTPIASAVAYSTGRAERNTVAFDPSDSTKFVVAYRDNGSGEGRAVVGSVNGTSISFGTTVKFADGGAQMDANAISFDPNQTGRFVIAHNSQVGNSAKGFATVGTRSGTNLSFGTSVQIFNSSLVLVSCEFDPQVSGKFLLNWGDSANNLLVGTLSGTTLSFGTLVTLSGTYNQPNLAVDPINAGKYVISYQDGADSDHGYAAVVTVAGTTPSRGTPVKFLSAACERPHVVYDSGVSNAFVIAFVDAGDSNKAKAVAGVVSGTSLSLGSTIIYNATSSASTYIAADPNNTGTFVATSDDGVGRATVLARSSTNTVTAGTSYALFNAANTDGAVEFNPSTSKKGQFVYVTEDRAGSPFAGKAVIGQLASTLSTNLTATNFLGTATAAYTNGQTASIMLQGGISDNQSSLTAGSTYYVQPNGTFATSAGTPSVLAGKAVSATSLLLNGLDEIPSQTGNTGKFLTTNGSAASWGTVAPAGLVLVGTVTAASAASIIISGLFSSTYDVYKIFGTQLQGDAENTNLELRFGASDYFPDSGYRFHVHRNNSADTNGSNTYLATNDNSDPSIEVINKVGNEANQAGDSASFEMNIYNPLDAVLHTNVSFTGINQKEGARMMFGVGSNQANISVTRLKFFTSSSTFSGTFKIYGVAK